LNRLLQRTNGVLPVNKSTCALGDPSVFFGRRLRFAQNTRSLGERARDRFFWQVKAAEKWQPKS